MLDIIRKLPSILLALLFIGCISIENNDTQSSNYELKPSSEIRFPLDSSTSYKFTFLTSFTDSLGNELMVCLANQKPSIQYYDINTSRLVKETFLSKIGPNSTGSVSQGGLCIKSLDSIYVISASRYTISLLSGNGSKLKSYNTLLGDTYNENTGMLHPFTWAPVICLHDKLYLNIVPDRDPHTPSFYKGYVNLMLDLKTGKSQYFNHYPNEYSEKIWGIEAMQYSTAYNQITNKFIYSFALSDSINVMDPITMTTQRYWAGTKYKKNLTKPMEIPDNEHDLEYYMANFHYKAIIYDKYKDVYYRIVDHPYPFKSSDGKINSSFKKPQSIIILDKSFKIIGESKINPNIFISYIYFLTSQGLYLSNGNPENPDLVENYAVFTCFKLVPNEKK